MKKQIIISVIALLLVVGAVSAMTVTGTPKEINELLKGEQQTVEIMDTPPEINLGGTPVMSGIGIDIIGSKTGTTTTGTYFAAGSATSTYSTYIGPQANRVIYTLGIKDASSTPPDDIFFSVLTSNDNDCETATTTTTMSDTVIASDINWFDAGRYILNLAGSATIPAATSTLVWNPTDISNQQIILDGLTTRCVALQVKASSTELWGQIITNEYNN